MRSLRFRWKCAKPTLSLLAEIESERKHWADLGTTIPLLVVSLPPGRRGSGPTHRLQFCPGLDRPSRVVQKGRVVAVYAWELTSPQSEGLTREDTFRETRESGFAAEVFYLFFSVHRRASTSQDGGSCIWNLKISPVRGEPLTWKEDLTGFQPPPTCPTRPLPAVWPPVSLYVKPRPLFTVCVTLFCLNPVWSLTSILGMAGTRVFICFV